MLRKFVWLFVVLPAGVVLVAFALANRHAVRLNLDPFSADDPILAFDAPFFLYLFSALMLGLLLGGFATWLGQGKWRRQARERGREAARLRMEAGQLDARARELAAEQAGRAEAAE